MTAFIVGWELWWRGRPHPSRSCAIAAAAAAGSGWCYRLKSNLRFEYSALEDEVAAG